MAIKLNTAEKCEIITISISRESHPIAWDNKLKSLIKSGLSEAEAEQNLILYPEIEMELYYDPELGAFLIESEAVESTDIFNPYSGEILEIEDEN